MHTIVLEVTPPVTPFLSTVWKVTTITINLMFGLKTKLGPTATDHNRFVIKWKEQIKEAYAIAPKNASKSQYVYNLNMSMNASKSPERRKTYYDQKAHSSVLQQGDRVLVKNVGKQEGPGKLRAYWEDKVYVVVQRNGENSPVGKTRTWPYQEQDSPSESPSSMR